MIEIFKNQEGRYGLREDGVIIIPPQYAYIIGRNYEEYFRLMNEDGLWAYARKDGTIFTPFVYDALESMFDGFGVVKRNGLFGIVNYEGIEFLKPLYDKVGEFNPHEDPVLIPVMVNGLWGYVRPDGSTVTPPIYSKAGYLLDGRADVCLNGKWGFINGDGETVVLPIYDHQGVFNDEGVAEMFLDGVTVYIDRDGKRLN